ncbi:MAG: hypothetical protein LRS47_01160 [Desulfurococcales archaeon]|nr:hypothetical protein [Desulfurococcales archaeon]
MSRYLSSDTKPRASGKVCPICGRQESPELPFIGSLCRDCFLEKYGVAYVPPRVRVIICNSCGAYKINRQWVYTHPLTLEEAAYEAVYGALLSSIKPVNGLKTVYLKDIHPLAPIETFGEYDFEAVIGGESLEGVQLEKKYIVKARISAGLCPRCIKRKVGYHEALIQIRGIDGRLEEPFRGNIVSFLENLSDRLKEQIVDVIDKKEGIDILVSDATSARIIASKISGSFIGKRIETYSLSGRRNDGRRLGHLTISLRVASTRKGELLSIDGKPYYVRELSSGRVRLVNLETGREEAMDAEHFWSHRVSKLSDTGNTKRLMLLSLDSRNAVFIDVESGYTTTLEYSTDNVYSLIDRKLLEGEEYIVYLTGSRLYIIS